MTGFDPDYDMVLVFGVLRELAPGYDDLYQRLLNDWRTANSGFEKYVIKERW
ncbi:hypothetical protein D3C74_298030 [compost metagenome]